jgi:predicted enzyme related to lactoylglutathione lyase
MTNQVSYFEIQGDDLARAKKFYSDIFGWEFTKQEGLPVEYWRINAAGQRGGLLKRPAPGTAMNTGANAFVCSIEVASYDDVHTKIIGGGGKVALPKFAVPGVCWQGYFLDTENNVFGIFEPNPNAK